MIELIGPDGKPWELDNDDPAALNEAMRQGFTRPVEKAQPVGALEAALQAGADATDIAGTTAFGAVQGLTGGLAGVALGKNPGNRAAAQFAERSKEEHPIAYGSGELAGMVASPLNALGAAAEGPRAASALGRVAQKGLGGATMGGLFGAGSTVSDAVLGDHELTADRVIAGAGLGALLGFAGGGMGGAIEEGARAVLPRLGRLAGDGQQVLDGLANDSTISATQAQQGVINRMGEERAGAAAHALRDRGHLEALSTPDDILKAVEGDLAKTGAEKSSILELAEAGGAKPSYSELGSRLEEFKASKNPLQRKIIAGDLSELQEGVAEIGARPVSATGRDGSGFRALDDLRQSVAKRAKFSRGPAGVDDEALGLKRELAGVFRDEIDRQLVPQLGSDIGKHYADTKALYGALKDAATLAKSGAGRVGGLGLKDLAVGAIGGSLHPAGIATALASKFMREHGPALVAKTADAISKSPALMAVAKSMGSSIPSVAPKMGPYGVALAEAFGSSPASGLAHHMTMAHVDPNYSATAQLAGLAAEGPAEHAASLARAEGLATIDAAARAGDEAIDRYIGHVLRGEREPHDAAKALGRQDFGAMRMRRDVGDAHDKRVQEIQQMAADPSALVDRVAQNLQQVGPVAPGLASALTARANLAVQYLAKAAARPMKAGPLARDWTPTDAERHEFTQKLEVVQEPMSVLRHAAAGTLVDGQLEALRAVYPTLAQGIADKALERALGVKDVPYRAKMMLTLLTGVDVDGSMGGQAIMSNQTANRATKRDTPNAAQQPAGRSEMTLAARTALPEQRREMEAGE